MPDLAETLAAFRATAKPGPWSYQWHGHHDGGEHDGHIVFGIMTHGDEVGALPAAVRLLEELNKGALRYGGRCTVVVGNPEAGLQGRRFIDADLNRVFTDGFDEQLHEVKRSREMMPILASADLFLDFHQTIQPTAEGFYIGPFDRPGWKWARVLRCADVWVTRPLGKSFSVGTCCADEYVRNKGRAAMTVELSQKGFDASTEATAIRTMTSALRTMDALRRGEATLDRLAQEHQDLAFYEAVHAEPFHAPELALKPGLMNFQAVTKGALLSAEGTPELRAPLSGKLLFPKYPERDAAGLATVQRPNELYRIVQRMDTHPIDAWP